MHEIIVAGEIAPEKTAVVFLIEGQSPVNMFFLFIFLFYLVCSRYLSFNVHLVMSASLKNAFCLKSAALLDSYWESAALLDSYWESAQGVGNYHRPSHYKDKQ